MVSTDLVPDGPGPLELLRRPNLRLWQNLTPADLARTGKHTERNPESLDLLRTLLAGHDLLHLEQLTRLLVANIGVRPHPIDPDTSEHLWALSERLTAVQFEE